MPKITGGKAHLGRLKRLTSPEARAGIGAALARAGGEIEDIAKGSIMRGSASGTKTDKHRHVASAPGEPPKNFSQHLHDNIETVQDPDDPLHVTVSSNAAYSVALEFGTSKMAERPFMRPAAAAGRKEAARLVRAAVEHIDKGGKVG